MGMSRRPTEGFGMIGRSSQALLLFPTVPDSTHALSFPFPFPAWHIRTTEEYAAISGPEDGMFPPPSSVGCRNPQLLTFTPDFLSGVFVPLL